MDESQFKALYEAHFDTILRALTRLPLSLEEREDVAQTTFFSYWVFAQANSVEKPLAFLVASARNRAFSVLRQRKVQRTDALESHAELPATALASGTDEGAQAQTAREARIEKVRKVLHQHTRRTGNDTLWERYAEGRRLCDIARARREPLGTVCARVSVSRLPRALVVALREAAGEFGTFAVPS